MSELRWTLLILGVVFIAALSWWERRRPRQAFAPRLREASLGHGSEPRGGEHPDTSALPEIHTRDGGGDPGWRPSPPGIGGAGAHAREPWIGDAEIPDAVISAAALVDAADTHEPAGHDVARAHSDSSGPAPLDDLPTLIIPDDFPAPDPASRMRASQGAAWDFEPPPEPTLVDPEAHRAAPAPAEAAQITGAEGVGAVRIVEPAASGGDGAAALEPIVEWPPEESRRILALRLVAPHPERFAGRTLRLGLAAEGFLLGKFSIFHKPDEANRAVLSAASLTRPGAFDLETMDLQRYAGLSLFAVLPGPQAPTEAFEELLATARNLNERLQGALQDERGGPLTSMCVASIRESLRAEAPHPPAAAAHGT